MAEAPDKSRIPVCRSEFLQDVSIELGRRLRAVRYLAKGRHGLEFTIKEDEEDGESFSAIRTLERCGWVMIVVWEDGTVFYELREIRKNYARAKITRFRVAPGKLDAFETADLIRDTLRSYWAEEVQEVWNKLDVKE